MKRILAFLFASLLLLAGCTAQTYDNFGVSSSATESEYSNEKSTVNENSSLIPTAKKLLDSDKTVSKLFVGGLLTELISTAGKDSVDYTSAAGTKYEDFSIIEKLLASTYSVPSGIIQKYLSFPQYGSRLIISKDGKTYFSFHYKENYTGIKTDSITISDGLNSNEKKISADGYTLTMVYDGASWLLEDSVYFLQKAKETPVETTAVFPNMNKGSAAALSGKILVLEIFVTEKKGSFTADKVALYDTKIKDSMSFILNSSVKYNSSFTFDYKQLYFTHSQAINFAASDPYSFDMVLTTTNYGAFDKYIKSNVDISGYSGYFAVICADKTGSGFALPYSDDKSKVLSTERCVLFSNDDSGLLTKNILSLFGAETQTDAALVKLMKNYCENEVMFAPPLKITVISSLTAYQTGMTKFLDNQFKAFLPKAS